VILIGESGTGKTSTFLRYTQNKFFLCMPSSTGIDFTEKIITYKAKKIRIILWDTAGNERYRVASVDRLKNKDVVIFIYALNQLTSLDEIISFWMP
jgi:small GTP-binding protein